MQISKYEKPESRHDDRCIGNQSLSVAVAVFYSFTTDGDAEKQVHESCIDGGRVGVARKGSRRDSGGRCGESRGKRMGGWPMLSLIAVKRIQPVV